MVESIDHRVVLHGVSWADYERLLAVRGESAVPRLTYLAGELELMTPSRSHESIKTLIARLVEAYADERGIDLNGFGSWTIKSAPRERGLEPDECYIVGAPGERETPDLAIEVEWTKRLVDKLEVYRGLGLAEVWVWRRGRIEVHVLAGEEYRRVGTSSLFPDLDLAVLAHHVESPSQTQAVRDFRAWLRERR
jgi:Uma2 family endonuclease